MHSIIALLAIPVSMHLIATTCTALIAAMKARRERINEKYYNPKDTISPAYIFKKVFKEVFIDYITLSAFFRALM